MAFFFLDDVDTWTYFFIEKSLYTPPKINIKPENDGLEDDFPLLRFHVKLPGCHKYIV